RRARRARHDRDSGTARTARRRARDPGAAPRPRDAAAALRRARRARRWRRTPRIEPAPVERRPRAPHPPGRRPGTLAGFPNDPPRSQGAGAPRSMSLAERSAELGKTGAGEGIRTLDPNLGKVVLYP